jgi:hypothetical protein
MARCDAKRGTIAICNGGGMGLAYPLERPS